MKFRIAINGFGRIGRCVLRTLHERKLTHQLQVVVINDLADAETLRYITQYDSTHGRFPGHLSTQGQQLIANGHSMRVLQCADAAQIDWRAYDIDLLMECSGTFKDRATAEAQLAKGARRVLFSNPAQADVDLTCIYGFNEQALRAEHQIVSAGACSTHCLVPVLRVLHERFTILSGLTTTLHSAMNDQPLIDASSPNLRHTRAAMSSMIPVETELPKGVARLMPEMTDKFASLHVRVPTLNVSAMDLSVLFKQPVTVAEINNCLQEEAFRMPNILGFTLEPHASVDFNHDARSGIIDGTQTQVSAKQLAKIFIWFDNEWGFANRMLDTAFYWLQLQDQ